MEAVRGQLALRSHNKADSKDHLASPNMPPQQHTALASQDSEVDLEIILTRYI
jgi:hypothetical protein